MPLYQPTVTTSPRAIGSLLISVLLSVLFLCLWLTEIQRSLLDDTESVLDDTKVGLDDTKVSGVVYPWD